MFAPAAILPVLGICDFVVALHSPISEDVASDDVSVATALVCEAPTGDCSLVGTCEYCCIGEPGTGRCHTHGITVCGSGFFHKDKKKQG
ncbi:hypothetical protein VUR80DRAFT_4458 [Thermomyces stellatus]